jgi:hypothetical protein
MRRWGGTTRRRLRGLLRLYGIHHGKVLSREAVIVLARLVKEHAVAVVALLATQVCGTILSGAVLGSRNEVSLLIVTRTA